MINIGIGIDTGGTYTDAVVYDFTANTVLYSAKSLTTKDDLSIGILNVLDKLPYDVIKDVKVISLSTTLATNACVEDRGGRAKLIFFGGDRKVIDTLGKKYGLPPVEDVYIQESFTKFSGEIEKELDWELFESNIETISSDLDGIGVLEMFAMKNNAAVEKKAKEYINKNTDIPVVCGYELFSDLNCLQRGAGTLLNAKLFPIIKDFIGAIRSALTKRNISASLIIVRSDGSLMSEEFANLHPVETLICGPAASVLGSAKLVNEPNSIVVDMGGTTTDIAVIKNYQPIKVKDGVNIGKWRTYVKGLYLKTVGLGGDSAVHYSGGKIYLEEYRVIPLCIASEKYPVIIENIKNIDYDNLMENLHEHYILIKDITDSDRYTDEEKRICAMLKENPLSLNDIAVKFDRSVRRIPVQNLLREGVVQVCGLTPTDIMHIKGDFGDFETKSSLAGAEYIARVNGISVDKLCEVVYDEIKRKIYLNVINILLETENDEYMTNGVSEKVNDLINQSYYMAKNPDINFIKSMFKTDFKLIGIGAPIHIFLDDVAKYLGTEAIIPKYHEVANAVGAIASDIYVTVNVEIKPVYAEIGIIGYTVYGNNSFEEYAEAEAFAIKEALETADKEARSRGASGEINVSYEILTNDAQARDGSVYLGTKVQAYAVGAI